MILKIYILPKKMDLFEQLMIEFSLSLLWFTWKAKYLK